MARIESKMMELGSKAHDFKLFSPSENKEISLTNMKSEKATLIIFISNHCPFVKHLNSALSTFAKKYIPKGLSVIAINSNDIVNYPDDSPENMIKQSKEFDFHFPYLFDETQEIAREYGAMCTPDFFLYDGDLKLRYRGQFDDSRPGNSIPVTGIDLSIAVDALLNNKLPSTDQKPSVGCGIKWK
ncbi:MAG: thioredoxin family protein [Ignavibacteriae bacterium HGW-Ignavibacteriae-4]|jgi:thiol-disulfide isomerase/thioredoxin|nr:MAG: thioredoxin family protein [Ignavibacteriae bacterium HGW-Ignavibacteriae-4]